MSWTQSVATCALLVMVTRLSAQGPPATRAQSNLTFLSDNRIQDQLRAVARHKPGDPESYLAMAALVDTFQPRDLRRSWALDENAHLALVEQLLHFALLNANEGNIDAHRITVLARRFLLVQPETFPRVLATHWDDADPLIRTATRQILESSGLFEISGTPKAFEHFEKYVNRVRTDSASEDDLGPLWRTLYAIDPDAALTTVMSLELPGTGSNRDQQFSERLRLVRYTAYLRYARIVAPWPPGSHGASGDPMAIEILKELSASQHWFTRMYVLEIMRNRVASEWPYYDKQVVERLTRDDHATIAEASKRLQEEVERHTHDTPR